MHGFEQVVQHDDEQNENNDFDKHNYLNDYGRVTVMKAITFSTVVVFICVVIMLGLSVWQISRGLDKQQRLAQVSQTDSQGVTSLQQGLLKREIQDTAITATGQFDHQRYFLLDNKIRNGRVGYEVIGIFNTLSESLLVNLGWVKAPLYRQQQPDVELPKDVVTILGRAWRPSVNPMVRETIDKVVQWPAVVQRIDVELKSEWLRQPLLPFMLVLTDNTSPELEKQWQPVVMPPEKHFGYAVQWFALAIAAGFIFVAVRRQQKT